MQVPELAPADAELRAAESMWHGRYTRPRRYRADDLRVDAFGHSARHTRNAGVHGEDGLAAQQHVQERELWDVPAQNDQAYRERRRQQQSYWAPKPGPEDRGNDNCQGGQSSL